MMRYPSLFFALFILHVTAFGQLNDRLLYIETYKHIAIAEMSRTGIPASIKLGQAILESNAGQSELSRKAKNHFGIKCGNWQGKGYFIEDDDKDENGKLKKSCFRTFRTPEESFIAHSEFLRDPNKSYRYGFLFNLNPYDYKAWAHGLKKAGYATNPEYAKILISVIENYKLFQFDNLEEPVNFAYSPKENKAAATFNFNRVLIQNDVKFLFSRKNETPAQIARRSKVALHRLLKYNEGLTEVNQQLKEKTRVYLQPKRNNFRGKKTWHYLKEGETMYDVAQLYGLKLDKLYKKNNISPPDQPAVDEGIRIRGKNKPHIRPVLTSESNPNHHLPPPAEDFIPDQDHDILIDSAILIFVDTEKPKDKKPETNIPVNKNPENKKIPTSKKEEIRANPLPAPTNDDQLDPSPEVDTSTKNTEAQNRQKESEILNTLNQLDIPISNLTVTVFNDEVTIEGSVTSPNNKALVADKIGNTPGISFVENKLQVIPTIFTNEYHIVVKGDTLFNISKRYNLSVEQLKSLNNLTDNTIFVNQQLKVK